MCIIEDMFRNVHSSTPRKQSVTPSTGEGINSGIFIQWNTNQQYKETNSGTHNSVDESLNIMLNDKRFI